jgi:hypothetical protein
MRIAIAGLALYLSGCALYFGKDDDDDDVTDDDIAPPWTDAGLDIDAGRVPPDAAPADCPAPTQDGRISICGRIRDVANSRPVGSAQSVTLTFYDALDYAANPTTSQPIVPGSLTIDVDGDYVATDLARPNLGFIGIVADDDPNAGTTAYAPTMLALPVAGGSTYGGTTAWVLRNATDTSWSQAAGLGTSFVTQGAVLGCFDYFGAPAPGVRITEAGNVEAANDYYFTDTNQLERINLSSMPTQTGADGCGLKINSSLVEHSGEGGAPPGCWWNSRLARAVPGALWVNTLGPLCGE